MVWPDSRTEIEEGFTDALVDAMQSSIPGDSGGIDEGGMADAVAGAAKPWFDTTAEDAIFAILLLLDDHFGPESLSSIRAVLTPAGIVATDQAAQLLGRQVASNTRGMVEELRKTNFRQSVGGDGAATAPGSRGGLTPTQVDVVFGRPRASRIAVTETTRMAEIAERSAMDVLRKSGVAVKRMWRTEKDDRVCPICRPLDGLPEHLWPSSFRNGPPTHPNCRCQAVIIGLDDLIR